MVKVKGAAKFTIDILRSIVWLFAQFFCSRFWLFHLFSFSKMKNKSFEDGKNRSENRRPSNLILTDCRKCYIVGLLLFSRFFVQCVQLHENVNKQLHLYRPKHTLFCLAFTMSIITNGLIREELHLLKVCPNIWLPPGV